MDDETDFGESNEALAPSAYYIDHDLDEAPESLRAIFDMFMQIQDDYNSQEEIALFWGLSCSRKDACEMIRRVMEPYDEMTMVICGLNAGYAVELLIDIVEGKGPNVIVANTATFVVQLPRGVFEANHVESPGTAAALAAHKTECERIVSRLKFLGLKEKSLALLQEHKHLEISAKTMQSMLEVVGQPISK